MNNSESESDLEFRVSGGHGEDDRVSLLQLVNVHIVRRLGELWG